MSDFYIKSTVMASALVSIEFNEYKMSQYSFNVFPTINI